VFFTRNAPSLSARLTRHTWLNLHHLYSKTRTCYTKRDRRDGALLVKNTRNGGMHLAQIMRRSPIAAKNVAEYNYDENWYGKPDY